MIEYAPENLLAALALEVVSLGSNSSRSRGTRDVHLDRRIAIAARVRTRGPSALLRQSNDPPLVAGELRLLLAKHFAVVQIAFGQ